MFGVNNWHIDLRTAYFSSLRSRGGMWDAMIFSVIIPSQSDRPVGNKAAPSPSVEATTVIQRR